MDEYIIETKTDAEAWIKQDETHDPRVAKYQTEGYPIVYVGDAGYESVSIVVGIDEDGIEITKDLAVGTAGILPKNIPAGFPAQPTWLWAIPALTPDDTFMFPVAVDVTPSYSGELGKDYGLYEMPQEWKYPDYDTDTMTARFDKTEFK